MISVERRASIKSLEVAVESQGINRFSNFRRGGSDYWTSVDGVDCIISSPSVDYLYAFICKNTNTQNRTRLYLNKYTEVDEVKPFPVSSLEEFCIRVKLNTLKITCASDVTLERLHEIMSSFLFNIAYVNDIVYTPYSFSSARDVRTRSKRRIGQLAPYLNYPSSLTNYYYQGVSTNIPFTQYLAFYHVAENYFQSISEQELYIYIKEYLTSPGFSPRNQRSIASLYTKLRKKMKDQREDGVWEERNGLLLTLKKYVPDLSVLKDTINALSPKAAIYYKVNSISFADGSPVVDLDKDGEETYQALRDRIYSVRNSIVHSKESDRSRYKPFIHDSELSKEIPLIRSVAELIIINSAEPF